MVPVQVRQVDVIGVQILDERGGRFGKIPPASPVARADQPRIGNDPNTIMLHAETSVAQYRKLHTTINSTLTSLDELRSGGQNGC